MVFEAGYERWFQVLILLVWTLPAFLPLIVRPQGDNRFGAPREAVGFWAAVVTGLRKYADFRGRASRSEYGWFLLLFLGVYFSAEMIEEAVKVSWGHLLSAALLVPYMAVSARRLHDLNRSGWWQLLIFGVGLFVLFFMFAEPSEEEKQARIEAVQ